MIDQLKNAIFNTVKQFQDYPLAFLSERDIQAVLFVELRNATNEVRYPYTAEPANRRFGCTDPFSIRPVTTEYYISQGKFDIAVLSEKPDSEKAIWGQPCRVGIEIKLWTPGYGDSDYLRDVQKLQRYQAELQNEGRSFTGIAMLFVHPWVKNEKKGKKRLPVILREPWKAILDEHSVDAYPENGVALHLVTDAKDGHRWQQFSGPSITE